jgi:tetratricopeptide (TPR) repeat protein
LARYDELADRMTETGNVAGLGQTHEEAGDVLFKADRDAHAAVRFGAAAEAFRAAAEPLAELRVLRRRAAALHWADDLPAAEEAVAFAGRRHTDLPAELAERPAAIWERAMLGFEASRMLMSRGRYAEALPHLTGAPERLRDIGATEDADQIEGMLGEALLRSGDPAAAIALLRRTIAGMGPDAPTMTIAVTVLAEALRALGRDGEADALLAEHSIDPTDR